MGQPPDHRLIDRRENLKMDTGLDFPNNFMYLESENNRYPSLLDNSSEFPMIICSTSSYLYYLGLDCK